MVLKGINLAADVVEVLSFLNNFTRPPDLILLSLFVVILFSHSKE